MRNPTPEEVATMRRASQIARELRLGNYENRDDGPEVIGFDVYRYTLENNIPMSPYLEWLFSKPETWPTQRMVHGSMSVAALELIAELTLNYEELSSFDPAFVRSVNATVRRALREA